MSMIGESWRATASLAVATAGFVILLLPLGCTTQRGAEQTAAAATGDAGPVSQKIGVPDEDAAIVTATTEAVRVSYARGGANYVIAGEATATGPRPDYTAEVSGPAGPTQPGGRGVGYPAPESVPAPVGPPQSRNAVSAPPPSPAGAVPLTSSFETIDTDTNVGHTGFLFIPPDSHAAVGPDHVVVVTNVTIRIHEKDGTLVHDDDLQDFFSAVSPATFTFDPKVLFDEEAQRFLVVTLELEGFGTATTADDESMAYLAVSDDANPLGTWYAIAIDSELNVSGNSWLDYPGFAVDEEAVYLNGNMFRFSDGAGTGVRLWTIEKGDGSGGWFDNGTAVVNGPFDPYGGAGLATTTQPAMIRSDPVATYGAPGADVGTFLVSYSGLTLDNTGGCDATCTEAVQIVRMDDPLGTPTFVQEFVDVGNLEDNVGFPGLTDAPQSGSATGIETNDRRSLDAVWRDGDLYMVATLDPFSGADSGEATAHWWKLDTSTLSTGGSANTTVDEQGNLGGEDIASNAHTFFPSVDINANGDLAVGYSASASSIFAGSYYSIREDGSGTFGAAETLRSGTDWYVRTFGGPRNRWGDYSGMVVDPATDCFWVYNQHAMTRGTATCTDPINGCPPGVIEEGRWRTAAGEICLEDGDCLASFTLTTVVSGTEVHKATDITVAGTAEVTATGNLTLQGQDVGFEDGFSVASGGEMHVVEGCP